LALAFCCASEFSRQLPATRNDKALIHQLFVGSPRKTPYACYAVTREAPKTAPVIPGLAPGIQSSDCGSLPAD
jgi:hypothetical protein